jgi:acyl-CoA thioesterase
MDEELLTLDEVLKTMLEKDQFSKWLGLCIDEYRTGYCKLHFVVNENMMNGLSIIHGGVIFSASDSAFAFACNSHGILTVALDCTISFTRSAKSGEVLTVEAREVHLGNKIGVYEVRTTNENAVLLALFKGTSYRTSKKLR